MGARPARTSDFAWLILKWSMRSLRAAREQAILIGLTSLKSSGLSSTGPKLKNRRAVLVLGKVGEILAQDRAAEQERDVRFIELGCYLCEVRTGQYWRIENLRSFDEFLEKRFPESRRKAYYLMAIHEQLPRRVHRDLKA